MGCFKFPSNVDHEVAEVWFTLCFTKGKAQTVRCGALHPHPFTLCFTWIRPHQYGALHPHQDSLICNITYSKSWISRSQYHTIFLDIATSTKLVKGNTSTLTEWNNCWIHNIFFVMTHHDITISNKFLKKLWSPSYRRKKCRKYYCQQISVQVKLLIW